MRRITWLGHATVLVEVAGARLITDPVLRPRVAHLRRHAPAAADPGRLDAVLLSHLHRDHLDVATLKALGAVPVIAPRGAARVLRGFAVDEVAVGDERRVGDASVRAVRAAHDGRRVPVGPPMDALGYVVEGVYFAGDTELFAGMADLAPLDVALVPIWGWGPTLGPGHMDPEQAAEALALLRPAVAIPIHWGTLLPVGLRRRHGHLLRDPVEAFRAAAARAAPGVQVEVLEPGGSVDL